MYNLDYLKKISDNDTNFIKEILSTFNENAREVLDTTDGLVAEKRYDQLSRMIHKLIPNFNFIGATDFQPDLRILEKDLVESNNLDDTLKRVELFKQNLNLLLAKINEDFDLS